VHIAPSQVIQYVFKNDACGDGCVILCQCVS